MSNSRELLIISVGIFLTIVAWMVADLYRAKKNTVIEDVITEVHIPTYTINSRIFEVLKERTP